MNLVPSIIVVALGGAFLISLLGRRRCVSVCITCAATLCLLCLSLRAVALVHGAGIVVYKAGGWPPPFGICMVLDGLSVFMLVAVNLLAFLASVYSIDYMKRFTGAWKFYTLYMLMTAGMNGVIIAGDLFNMFVFLEIAAIASYALVAFGIESEELEAGFKYMVMGNLASGFILLGIALLYSFGSSLNMADLALALSRKPADSRLIMLAVGLFIAGFGLKAALVPFHAWLPDAHASAPAPISAMLSGVLIKTLGVYALARILFSVVGATSVMLNALMILGALSMTAGAFLAIGQWDFKRLLAYSSISQVGYIMLGLGLGTPLGVLGGLFHLINHSAFKALLFLNSGAVDYAAGTRDLRRMGGLRERMPVTAGTSLVASMSIAGVPPFNGFWSKLVIIVACVQAGRSAYGILAAAVSIITLAMMMKVQRYAFYGEPGEACRGAREVPFMMKFAMVALAVACVSGGLLLIPRVSQPFLIGAREALVAGRGYAERVFDAVGGGNTGREARPAAGMEDAEDLWLK